jgi:diguanylate cyclase (GGDEF)-like protein
LELTTRQFVTPVDEAARLQRLHLLAQNPVDQHRLARLVKLAANHLRAKSAKLGLVHSQHTEILAAWSTHAGAKPQHQVPRGASVCAQAILSHAAQVIHSADGVNAIACVPLLTEHGSAIGALCVLDDAPRSFCESDLDALEDYASLIEDELTRASAHAKIEQLTKRAEAAELRALTDPLTDLWNRQALTLWSEENRQQPCTVLMIDIDRFKTINDLHGHLLGDAALQMVANALRAALRPQDFLARYGGDEFLVCLPNCDTAGAQTLCDRLRGLVAAHSVQLDERVKLKVSISIGTAQHAPGTPFTESMLQADAALLAAKKTGKSSAGQQPQKRQQAA